MEKLFSVKAASTHYSYSQGYFRKLILHKKLAVVHFGRNVRMKQSVLDKHFAKLQAKYDAKYSA